MNTNELLHKRVLVAEKGSGYNSKQTVEEVKVLEVSPSGNFVKVQTMNGNKHWRHRSDITVIEILASLEAKPSEVNTNPKQH